MLRLLDHHWTCITHLMGPSGNTVVVVETSKLSNLFSIRVYELPDSPLLEPWSCLPSQIFIVTYLWSCIRVWLAQAWPNSHVPENIWKLARIEFYVYILHLTASVAFKSSHWYTVYEFSPCTSGVFNHVDLGNLHGTHIPSYSCSSSLPRDQSIPSDDRQAPSWETRQAVRTYTCLWIKMWITQGSQRRGGGKVNWKYDLVGQNARELFCYWCRIYEKLLCLETFLHGPRVHDHQYLSTLVSQCHQTPDWTDVLLYTKARNESDKFHRKLWRTSFRLTSSYMVRLVFKFKRRRV